MIGRKTPINGQKQYHRPLAENSLPRSTVLVWSLALMLLSFVLWANFYTLDEVTTGTGKVIPSSHEQIVQSLEGGIVHSINVQEGEVVERGQRLAQLDRTKTESGVQESLSRLHAVLATAARLTAQINDTPLVFPPELNNEPDLVKSETELYNSSRNSLEKQLSGLKQGVALIRRELSLTQQLVTGRGERCRSTAAATADQRNGKQGDRSGNAVSRPRGRGAGESQCGDRDSAFGNFRPQRLPQPTGLLLAGERHCKEYRG